MTRRRAAFGVLLVAAALASSRTNVSLCPFAAITGLPCPSCGLGRAALALFGGHPLEAIRFHPLVFAALPALAGLAWVARRANSTVGGPHRIGERRMVTAAAAVLLAAMFGVWIARFDGAFGGPVAVHSLFRPAR